MHYLDNAATTPLDPAVRAFMAEAYDELWGNPSSDSALGRAARRQLDVARDLLCGMLGARSVVFCGGGTEATNLAMRGTLRNDAHRGKQRAILVGEADHPAVLATAADLERDGHSVVRYPVNHLGRVRLDVFSQLVQSHGDRLAFASILHGNNENGTLAPVEAMIAVLRQHAPLAHVHVDAVQSFAKITVDLDRFDADSITIAAHKIHGPKGCGALALGPVRQPVAVCTGGGQELGLRSGTEDAVSARAFALAAENWISRQAEETGRVRALRDRAERELFAAIDDIEILGDSETRLPHLLPLGLRRVRGSLVREELEARGILVSTGSACASEHREHAGSHVHRAMGVVTALAGGALRISFGRFNSDDDVDALVDELPRIVARLRRTSA